MTLNACDFCIYHVITIIFINWPMCFLLECSSAVHEPWTCQTKLYLWPQIWSPQGIIKACTNKHLSKTTGNTMSQSAVVTIEATDESFKTVEIPFRHKFGILRHLHLLSQLVSWDRIAGKFKSSGKIESLFVRGALQYSASIHPYTWKYTWVAWDLHTCVANIIVQSLRGTIIA